MKAFFEIFRLEWRAALRSKAFALLFFASIAWMFLAPFVLKGDGTPDGVFELRARYSLGIVFIVSLVSLSAAAAGSLSRERAGKRLQLTLARPVRRFSVALARMAAFTSMGALVLGVSSLILSSQVAARPCYHSAAPVMESAESVVERTFAKYMAESEAFRESVKRMGEKTFKRYLLVHIAQFEEYARIEPGGSTNFVFAASAVKGEGAFAAGLKFTGFWGLMQDVGGRVALGSLEGSFSADSKRNLKIPLEPSAEGSEALPEGGVYSLTVTNLGSEPLTLSPRQDVRLMSLAGGFGMNLLRAWLELTAVLSLAVALSVAAGAAFGRSVAVFVSMSILFVMTVSPALVEDYPDPTTQDAVDRLTMSLTEAAAGAASPLAYSPIGSLVDDRAIEWPEAGRAACFNILLFPLALSLLSGFILARKPDDR